MEKAPVIRSLIYKFTERFAVKGIGLVISLLLARLIAPELFGEIALLMVFVDISLVLIEGGLGTALVQGREIEERDYSTVFLITLALSCVMIALLQLAAPLIARFYKSPGMVTPLRVYAFSLLFSSFNSVQVSRMQREMRFREMMFCNLAATLAAGTVGIFLAWRGAGLWALVAYYFAQIVTVCLALIFCLRWAPGLRFSLESARKLYGFGIKVLAASLITTIYNNLRTLIIGKRFSTADLGYYNRGQIFSSTVANNLDAALRAVMFPVYSRSQDDPAQLLAILRRTKQLGTFILAPVMFGMAAVAEPMVRLLLTDVWLPAVPYVVLLCIAEAQTTLTSSNLLATMSLGRSDLYARLEVLRRCLMLIVLAISVLVFRSVLAIAVGFVFSAWLDAFVTLLPLKKLLGYGALDQLRDIWKTLLAASVMAVAVYAFGLLTLPLLLKLLLQILLGAALYCSLCFLLKNENVPYLLSLLKTRGR